MHVTFRQLRLFLALADTGSVSAAARSMHVTQPTASMQLKEISTALGLPIYEIVGRKLSLTEVGKELAQTARSIAQAWDAFEQSVDALKGLSRGKLRIAVVSTAKYFMPRLLGSFCAEHAGIDISLEVLNRDGVVQRLSENLDDLYIMSLPPVYMDLHDEIFLPNPIVVIAPTSDPLVGRSRVGLHELAERRFILREQGSGTRTLTDRFFRNVRFRPNIRLELGSNEAVKESVAGRLGLGVISKHALRGLRSTDGLHILNVDGFPLLSAWHIVSPSAKPLSPIALAFKRHLQREASTLPLHQCDVDLS